MNSKEQMIKDYEKIINFVIKNMKLGFRHDELFDVGMIGFVKGLNNYNVSKGVTYFTFIKTCIENEIKHFLKIDGAKKRQAEIISLNTQISEDTELQDLLGYEINYADEIYSKNINNLILKEINSLNCRNQQVIKYIFGIENFERLSKVEIAKKFNMSKQNVHRIHYNFLKKIRKKLEKEVQNDKDN